MISFPKALSSAIVLFCFPAHSGFEAIAQLGPIAKEIGKRTAKKTKPIKNSRTAATTSALRAISKGRVTVNSLNVRSCPSTKCRVVGTKTKDQSVQIYDRRGDWLRISAGKTARWVAEEYVLDEAEKKLICTSKSSSSTKKKEADC